MGFWERKMVNAHIKILDPWLLYYCHESTNDNK
jgi:hypothetical protein